MGLTYRDAGVDLSRQEEVHRAARRLIEGRIEAYTSAVNLAGFELVLHTDGVGTKVLVLKRLGRMEVAGWDAVMMNANDVACDSARPLALVDYVAVPPGDEGLVEAVLRGVSEAARAVGAALLGGETAILPGMAVGAPDVAVAMLAVRSPGWRGNRAGVGDYVVLVSSRGLHANGYSLARRIVEERLPSGYEYRLSDGRSIGEHLAEPTANYTQLLLEAWGSYLLSGAAHVTGGGWSKVLRILPEGAVLEAEAPEPPEVFKVLVEAGGVEAAEAYRTWNMGVGLVLTSPGRREAEELVGLAHRHGFEAWVAGRVVAGEPGRRVVRVKVSWPSRLVVAYEG